MRVGLGVLAVGLGIAQAVFKFSFGLGSLVLTPCIVVLFYGGRYLTWKYGGYDLLEDTLGQYRTNLTSQPEGTPPSKNKD